MENLKDKSYPRTGESNKLKQRDKIKHNDKMKNRRKNSGLWNYVFETCS